MPIRIISWNVNGIRALMKKDLLNKYLQKRSPTIFCIGETKLSTPDDKEILSLKQNIKGFRYRYFNTSRARKGYSGVAIWSKKKPLKDTYGIGIEEFDKEGRAITLEYDSFYLINVYVPNSGQTLQRLQARVGTWDKHLQQYITTLELTKPVILVGDLNCAHMDVDVHNPKTCKSFAGFTPQERASFNQMLASTKLQDSYRYLHPSVVAYTYWSYRQNSRQKNKGWRIDYCLLSPKIIKRLTHAFIDSDVVGSDHCPVGITFEN